jgi:hypothetical protein
VAWSYRALLHEAVQAEAKAAAAASAKEASESAHQVDGLVSSFTHFIRAMDWTSVAYCIKYNKLVS